MRRRNLTLWCCTLLFVASASKTRGNSTTSDDGRTNSTVRYEIYANVTMTNRSDADAEAVRYNENSTKNKDVRYEFHANSTSNVHEDDDLVQHEFHAHLSKDHEGGSQMPTRLRANSTKVDDKSNSTSHEPHGNLMQVEDRSNLILYELLGKSYQDNNTKNVIPYEMCENSTCIPLCCSLDSRLIKEKCIAGNTDYPFPDVYEYATNDSFERGPIGKRLNQIFQLTAHDPCRGNHFVLDPHFNSNDEYMFLINGSLYLPRTDQFVKSYCLAVLQKDKYEVAVCFDLDEEEIVPEEEGPFLPVGLIISMPFLLATFVVYSILPELRNMHGYTLRGYVGSLFVAYLFLATVQLSEQNIISDVLCIVLGIAYNNMQ